MMEETFMDENIIRRKRERRKGISIKLPVSACRFMAEKNYSPTRIMLEALRVLGWKNEEQSGGKKNERTKK